MEIAEFVRLYPRLFHLAADGSWASIRRLGLLSSRALLDRWGAPDPGLRKQSVRLDHPDFGTAVMRDQKPLHISSLEMALGGEMIVDEWLTELNSRVFFFVDPKSLFGMLNSPSYRRDAHTVITLDTASFMAVHGEAVELTDMNTGFAQPHNHKARGRGTFQLIADFRHPVRRHAYSVKKRDVVEVCVRGAVRDVAAHVRHVERYQRRVFLPQP